MLMFCSMGVHLMSRDLLKFCEISANISETVQGRHIITIKANRKSHVSNRMAAISMTLGDLECHFWPFLNLSNFYSSMNMTHINYIMCIHEWKSAYGL